MEVNLQNNIIPAKMLSAACWVGKHKHRRGIFLEALSILDRTETSTKEDIVSLHPALTGVQSLDS